MTKRKTLSLILITGWRLLREESACGRCCRPAPANQAEALEIP